MLRLRSCTWNYADTHYSSRSGNSDRKQLSTLPVETVSLLDAHGRFLREDIIADRPLPPFDRVMMDGIAICYESFADGQRHFPIEAIQAAGEPSRSLSSPDHCIEVMTGCALPSGCDCVIPVEEIEMCDQSATLIESCNPKHRQHIHPMGSDTSQGNQLLETGTQLQAPRTDHCRLMWIHKHQRHPTSSYPHHQHR